MTSEYIARFKSLSPASRARLVQAIREGQTPTSQQEMAPGRTEQDRAPLSFSQQRMWFLHQWEPASPLYTISTALRLSGRLDRRAIVRSLTEIIGRHEILRTTFALSEGNPCQQIHAACAFALPLIDLCTLPATSQAARSAEVITSLAQRPFDLQHGPLLRAIVLQVAEQEHILALTVHHIVADGWSMHLLLKELCSLYQAFSAGDPSPLADLPLQYADYACWQRTWLQGPPLEKHLTYWTEHLANLPTLELPLDHPRPAVHSARGATLAFSLSSSLTAQLNQFSRNEGVTLFMVLLTAFVCLLARYSGQDDLVIGTPLANRSRPEFEQLIGCFANTLVLRADLRGNPTFRQMLQRLRDVCLDAYTHQDLPFERLVEELRPARDESRNPLFQVLFALQNEPAASAELADLHLEEVEIRPGTARLDLTVNLTELPRGLVGEVEYSTDLWQAHTVAALVERYRLIIESIVSQPAQLVWALPLLTPREEQQLRAWNATQVQHPAHSSLQHLCEAQARLRPDALALTCGDQHLTYGFLNTCASQLASRLRTMGAQAEMLIGLCLQRSPEQLIALLAILKSGAAVLPLDPDHPQKRLASILQATGLSVLLTDQSSFALFSGILARPLVLDTPELLRDCLCAPSGAEEEAGQYETHPDHLAYVLFTSGSTGEPRGVAVAQRAIVNRLLWGQRAYPLGRADRVLHVAALSFDIAFWEIFGPWLAGSQIVLAKPAGHADTHYLAELLAEQEVTVAHVVPTVLRHLLEEPALSRRCALRALFCGGDRVPADLPEHAVAHLHVDFCQFYGPTEAAINATAWFAHPQDERQGAPIGRPIDNTQISLLDANLRPVPIGAPGDVYISGKGLARCYVMQPDLTAERFLPHPTSTEAGARLYRTGDRARYRPDGNLEYLNRSDTQVKIHGMRVELSEIEHILCAHPQIRAAAVLAREDTPGLKRLVAYLVLQPAAMGEAESPLSRPGSPQLSALLDDVRAFLRRRLPGYMLPAALVVMATLPLNANGKVHRRALPAPEEPTDQDGNTPVSPRTDRERQLLQIFQQVLQVSVPGIHANFFALGGHSLLATRAVSAINTLCHSALSLRDFFEQPSVAAIAQAIAHSQGSTPAPPPAITHIARDEAEQLIARLDQLSDAEVEALLAARGAEAEPDPGSLPQSGPPSSWL